jgi:hypothetical protein
MRFDLRRYLRFLYIALFKGGDPEARLTPRRVLWLLFFYTLFPLYEIWTWLAFRLDNVLFPEYRQVSIEAPVFIVGNPRSGTTFFQRLLSQDKGHFTWMRTWEMLLAPSITQRRLYRGLAALDRRLGKPVHALVLRLQAKWQAANALHTIALRRPEEDEYIFLHIWSTVMVWLFSGFLDYVDDWAYFDQRIPPRDKKRVMDFYARCIRRHQYVHGTEGKFYLAKNPSFCPKIETLRATFPDAKFIVLVRNPLDMVPSFIHILNFTWQVMGDPVVAHNGYPKVLDLIEHWYTYPLSRLEDAPEDQAVVVNFEEMVADPDRTVRSIYDRFGWQVSPAYGEALHQATIRSRNHEGHPPYDIAAMGLTREQIVTRYAEIFERFGFDTRAPEAHDTASANGIHTEEDR